MSITKTKRVVAEVAGVTMKPGHLYFINKQGNLGSIQRNPGHVIGAQHPKRLVKKLSIVKRKGYMYYPKPVGDIIQVIEQPLHRN